MEIQHLTPWHSVPVAFAAPGPSAGAHSMPAVEARAPAADSAPGRADILEATTRALNALLRASNTSLRFELDRTSATVFVRLVDEATGQVIRRFSTAQLLAASGMVGGRNGLLLEDHA